MTSFMCESWVGEKYIHPDGIPLVKVPFGTDCFLSKKMMPVAHFGLFGDEFD